MRKTLSVVLAAGALMAAMAPGVASAGQPIVSNVGISCLVDGVPKPQGAEIRGPIGEVRKEIATEWYKVCDPGTVEITAFDIEE